MPMRMRKDSVEKTLALHEMYLAHDYRGVSADFRDRNLSFFDFSGRNLSFASFGGAILHSANFINADLMQADMAQADLYRACFAGATLTSVNLTGAHLFQTVFTGARLFHRDPMNWRNPDEVENYIVKRLVARATPANQLDPFERCEMFCYATDKGPVVCCGFDVLPLTEYRSLVLTPRFENNSVREALLILDYFEAAHAAL